MQGREQGIWTVRDGVMVSEWKGTCVAESVFNLLAFGI